MNVTDYLCCRDCNGKLKFKAKLLYCNKCHKSFPLEKGIYNFNEKDDKLVQEYQDFHRKEDPYQLVNSPRIVIEGHKRKIQILTKLFQRYNLKDKIILDIGSGDSIPEFLKECGVGIIQDISQFVLLRSKEKNKKGNFIFVASNKKLPCFSNSIDIIFSGEAIEHIKNLANFLKEIFRVLKPRGKLIITTPNSNAILYRLLGLVYSRTQQHISLQTYDSLIALLKTNFRINKTYGFNQSLFHYMDRMIKNKFFCKFWAKTFFKKPRYATGLIVEAEKCQN